MGTNIAKPAALLFTEEELGGPCFEQDSIVNPNVTPIVIVPNNGDRVGLLIFNTGASDLTISLDGNVSNSNGIILPANGGSLSLNVRDDFTLAARQWWGVAPQGITVYILEIIRYRTTPSGVTS